MRWGPGAAEVGRMSAAARDLPSRCGRSSDYPAIARDLGSNLSLVEYEALRQPAADVRGHGLNVSDRVGAKGCGFRLGGEAHDETVDLPSAER